MNMSYRRAWLLIDALNRCFRAPLVETQLGGLRGGGAALTPLGHDVIARYRAIERSAMKATSADLAALDAARASRPSGRRAAVAGQRSSSMPRRSRKTPAR